MSRIKPRVKRLLESRGTTTSLVFALLVAGVAAAMVAGQDDPGPAVSGPLTEPAPRQAETPRPQRPQADETVPEPVPAKKPKRRESRRFRATSAALGGLIEAKLGDTVRSGERRLLDARCVRGRCTARFYASNKGNGRVSEDLGAILRTLLRDPAFRSVDIFVHHEVVGRFKDERLPFLEVHCDRAAARAFVRGREERCRTVQRTGQDREAPHAKGGGPKPGKGPPEGRGAGSPGR